MTEITCYDMFNQNQLRFEREVLNRLALSVRQILQRANPTVISCLEEIRLRLGRPLMIRVNHGDFFVTCEGRLLSGVNGAYIVTSEDMRKTVQLISESSVYAFENEFRNGYLTIFGGHRVGLVGKAVLENGRVKTLKNISGLNFRFSQEFIGVADQIIGYLIDRKNERPYHTLIISPPRAGKTTLLRDLVRQLSDGIPQMGFPGLNIGVVDERSEIAACLDGKPQYEVGCRTDVLDGCPKAEGMMILLRSMAPQVVAADEIGRPEDVGAVEEMLNAGITVITTAHASSIKELEQRPTLRKLLKNGIFERLVVLSRSRGPGTVEAIMDRNRRLFCLKGG